jgi:hypothetical protein
MREKKFEEIFSKSSRSQIRYGRILSTEINIENKKNLFCKYFLGNFCSY